MSKGCIRLLPVMVGVVGTVGFFLTLYGIALNPGSSEVVYVLKDFFAGLTMLGGVIASIAELFPRQTAEERADYIRDFLTHQNESGGCKSSSRVWNGARHSG